MLLLLFHRFLRSNTENISRFVMNEARGIAERLNWEPVTHKKNGV